MPELDNATAGGDFLDLKPLAQDQTKVVFRVRELLADRPGTFGVNKPVLADVLICSGPNAGEVHEDGDYIGSGVTSPLRRAGVGKYVAGVLRVVAKQGRQPFVGLDPATPQELAEIQQVFKDGEGFKVARPLANATSSPAAGGSGSATESDEPPF